VLRKIEQLKMMRVPPDQTRQKIDQLIKQELTDFRIDEASHFILRISYCQTEELRRWFLQQECQLFRHRLLNLSESELARSVESFANVKPITRDHKDRLQEHLMQLMTPTEFATTSFYAVPFHQALDLVASRQCYLDKGVAYIPQAKVLSILVSKFRMQLSRCLAVMGTAGSFKAVEDPENARIFPLLKNLNRCLVNTEPTEEAGALSGAQQLNASNVDKYVANMPLCMRQLQSGMQQDKKLRHWGRLQYGLFLKGAGLSMDDALMFFQRHFSTVTGEAFQKQYSYNIRHMYGKEGKRATYTPYNCSKVILGNAPAANGDHHGCPYKHYDADHLGGLLQKLQVGSPEDRSSILRLQKSNQYQLACQKHFEVMHPKAVSMEVSVDNVGNHPNAWFRASVAYGEKLAETNNAGTTVSP
jgi:DNA primase large subunit